MGTTFTTLPKPTYNFVFTGSQHNKTSKLLG